MAVFVHGSGKILGDLQTIDIIDQNGRQAPALSVSGNYKNPPVDPHGLADNLMAVLNDTVPQNTLTSPAYRAGWIRHSQGIEFYFQDSPDLQDRKAISFHVLPTCPEALAGEITTKLFDAQNLKNIFQAMAPEQQKQDRNRGKKPPSRHF